VDEGHADSQFRITTGWSFLGSDASGNGVPACPPRPNEFRLPPTITVCVPSGECDFNVDGRVDVRDLVGMVHCVIDPAQCPAGPLTRFDCDGDGSFEIDDVLCCAQEVLSSPDCPGCPVDSVRATAGVGIEFGEAIPTATGIDVPIRVLGLDQVGAAKIRLGFPAARFDVSAVDAIGLYLHQVQGDEVVVGMIGPFPVADLKQGALHAAEVTLHLTLRPGQTAGGQVEVVSGDFSGPDGVKLEVKLGEPRVDLGPVRRFEVSHARPNPFSSETRFSVTLPAAGVLDVGVFDLAGRRVATVFRGSLGAGVHPFTWNGTDADGRRAPGGVYFYRAVVGGNSLVRRMVLLTPR
jgi:hypothetical protein